MPIKSLLAAKGARLMDGKGRTTKFPPCDMIFFCFWQTCATQSRSQRLWSFWLAPVRSPLTENAPRVDFSGSISGALVWKVGHMFVPGPFLWDICNTDDGRNVTKTLTFSCTFLLSFFSFSNFRFPRSRRRTIAYSNSEQNTNKKHTIKYLSMALT